MVETEIDLSGSRILVIDDEPDNLDLLCRALESAHYEVQVAVNGKKGLEVAESSHPDLILLDVMMPDLNGYEVCRQLKAKETLQDIPVIFLTGLDAASDVVEGFRAGGIDYIRKPFHKEEVLVRVQMHLERGQLIETLTRESEELVKLNAQLEEIVDERTQALHQKVIELEGKNRIAQSLLTVHTLPQTLNLVLESITQVITLNRGVIYLVDNHELKPASAFGVLGMDGIVSSEQLDSFKPSAKLQQAMEDLQKQQTVMHGQTDDVGEVFTLVPILRDDDLLGLIEIVGTTPINKDALHTLDGFALQAAVAISDAQMTSDTHWKQQLEGALKPT